MVIAAVDTCLIFGESALNLIGKIPWVSSYSGPVRIIAGQVMLVAAALLALLSIIVSRVKEDPTLDISHECSIYAVHGMANWTRGYVESHFIIGNLCTFFYDLSGNRLRYLTERPHA